MHKISKPKYSNNFKLNLNFLVVAKKFLGLMLVIVGSILLGIWAIKGTIALRNMLLATGSIISAIFLYQSYKNQSVNFVAKKWVPVVFLALLFCWVVLHYLFFSQDAIKQLNELRSTWLRAFMASIMGIGIAFAVGERPARIVWFSLTLVVAFLALIAEYVPHALEHHTLFYTNYFRNIFSGKINGVLIGLILISGTLGYHYDSNKKLGKWFFFCLFIVAYSFVFILDTRIGILLVIALMLHHMFRKKYLRLPIAMVLIAVVVIHIQKNSGWQNFYEDVSLGYQYEKFENWKNLDKSGPLITDDGRVVTSSNYQRTALLIKGLSLAKKQILGNGLLDATLAVEMSSEGFERSVSPKSTHSGLIDLWLSFGYLGIGLIISSISLKIAQTKSNPAFKNTIRILGTTIIVVYFLGELSSKHSIEILMFLTSFIASLGIGYEEPKTI